MLGIAEEELLLLFIGQHCYFDSYLAAPSELCYIKVYYLLPVFRQNINLSIRTLFQTFMYT